MSDLFNNQKTLTKVVRKLEPGAQYIGQNWLEMADVATKETMWEIINPSNGMASLRSEDAEAKIVDRPAFDRAFADLVDIAEKERFNVTDLRDIREAGQAEVLGPDSQLAARATVAKKKQRKALERLRTRVDNRIEWLRINALQGAIAYDENGIKFSVDYGVPADQKGVVPSTLWSDTANATPLEDIQTWEKTVIDRTGISGFGTMICSHQTLLNLAQNQGIRDVLQYTNPMWSIEAAKSFVESQTGMTIVKYDGQYKDESGTLQRFLDVDRVIFLPKSSDLDGPLGDMATAPHPHAGWRTGYYGWTEEKKDPYAHYVGVGIQAFPRLYHPTAIFTADVTSS